MSENIEPAAGKTAPKNSAGWLKNSTEWLDILFEDNHIIIVNKRPGEIVQGDKTGDTPLSEIVAGFIARRDA